VPDLVTSFLIQERRRHVTTAQARSAIGRRAPSLKTVETRYNGALQRAQVIINRQVRIAIEPLKKETLRQDATLDPIDALFRDLAEGILEIINGALVQTAITTTAHATDAVNSRKYDISIYRQLGLNAVPAELIDNWIKRNTDLITNTNAKQLRDLQGLFRDNAFSGIRATELEERINDIFRGTRKNIALIAQDQVQKLNGQLDQLKQTEAGIDGYYWRTSRDERVRSSHASREGQFFLWDKPPSGGHPGQDIRCRCDAEPALESLLFEGRELKQERKRIEAENTAKRAEAVRKSKIGPLKKKRRK
jgi:SPP1 gp7 family putative phage head morphogenesis protein